MTAQLEAGREERIREIRRELSSLFFLINGYTTGFQASVLGNMIDMTVKPRFGGIITADEVCLPVTAGGVLPCGASGRWQRG